MNSLEIFLIFRQYPWDESPPDRNCKFVCEEILKASPDMPIIITTGFDDEEQKKEMEKKGIKGYLIKPFDIMNLIEIIFKSYLISLIAY